MSDNVRFEEAQDLQPVPATGEIARDAILAHRARGRGSQQPKEGAAGIYAPVRGEPRGLIWSERDYAAPGLVVKAKVVGEFPRSLAFYNYSSLAVFGSFNDRAPMPGEDTWFCPAWGMVVVGCTSRRIAARFDPNGTQANTPSATSLLERYIFQVFDVDMGPLLWWTAAAPTS